MLLLFVTGYSSLEKFMMSVEKSPVDEAECSAKARAGAGRGLASRDAEAEAEAVRRFRTHGWDSY